MIPLLCSLSSAVQWTIEKNMGHILRLRSGEVKPPLHHFDLLLDAAGHFTYIAQAQDRKLKCILTISEKKHSL